MADMIFKIVNGKNRKNITTRDMSGSRKGYHHTRKKIVYLHLFHLSFYKYFLSDALKTEKN